MQHNQVPAFRNTAALLESLPEQNVARTLKSLGLWTATAHSRTTTRPEFVKNLAGMASHDLADEQAKWTSEAGRIMELHGLLTSQKVRTDLEVKVAHAKARAAVRAKHDKEPTSDGKPPKRLTAGEVSDLAEEEPMLIDARERALIVEMTLASLSAIKEATLMYLNTLSREITRRGDMARVAR